MAIVFGFNGAISSRPNQKNLDDDDDDDAFSKTGERERERENETKETRCSFFCRDKEVIFDCFFITKKRNFLFIFFPKEEEEKKTDGSKKPLSGRVVTKKRAITVK